MTKGWPARTRRAGSLGRVDLKPTYSWLATAWLVAFSAASLSAGEFVGVFESPSEVPLRFAQAGRIGSVAVSAGDQVATGQILATLESDSEAAWVRIQQARQEAADLWSAAAARSAAGQETRDRELRFRELDLEFRRLQATREALLIRAPTGGVVTKIQFQRGADILPGGPAVVTLQPINALFVSLAIPATDAARLAPGAGVRIQAGQPSQSGEGVVFRLDSHGPSPRALIRVENNQQQFVPGQTCRVSTSAAGAPTQIAEIDDFTPVR